MRERLLHAAKPAVMALLSLRVRLVSGITFGVRGFVTDGEGGILLVRHSYVPGWYLPGGGVEPGETALASLDRELGEEAAIAIDGPATLMGLYFNQKMAGRDHVAVYHVPAWRRLGDFKPGAEILECRFFPMADLPQTATDATRQRVAEHLGQSPISPHW